MRRKRRRQKPPPDQANSAQATNPTASPASFPPDGSDSVPETELEPKVGNDQSEVSPLSQSGKSGRSKSVRSKGKSNIPHWRLEQLRAAGRARGEQLKRDKEHQRKAGKARASSGDMKELAAKGNAKANEKNPNHQSNARRGKKKKPKTSNNGKTIRKGQAGGITRNDEINEDESPHKFEEATGEEEQQ